MNPLKRMNALIKRNKINEAISIAEDLTLSDPGIYDCLLLGAKTALNQKQNRRALKLATQLYLSKQEQCTADDLFLLGVASHNMGCFNDAEVAYQRCLTQNPHHYLAQKYYLGLLLLLASKPDYVLKLSRSLLRQPKFFNQTLLSLLIFAQQHSKAQLIEYQTFIYQHLERIEPATMERIINIYRVSSLFDFSRKLIELLKEKYPNNLQPKILEAQLLAAEGENEKADDILDDLSVAPNFSYLYLKGNLALQKRDYLSAFSHITKAAELKQRDIKPPEFDTFEIMKRVNPNVVKAPSHRKTAFLLGFPRSGTTLLERVIDTVDDVFTINEMSPFNFITSTGEDAMSWVTQLNTSNGNFLKVEQSKYFEIANKILPPDSKASMFLDKSPWHTTFLPVIDKLLPDSKIIVALRHPMDVIISCAFQNFSNHAFNDYLVGFRECTNRYKSIMEAYIEQRETLELDILEVKYEDIVNDFDNQLTKIADFLAISFPKDAADFYKKNQDRAITSASSHQATKAVYSSSLDKWRHFEPYLQDEIKTLKPLINKLGYFI